LYHQSIGIILYLTHTHHDISFFVGLVARYMQKPHSRAIRKQQKGYFDISMVQFGLGYIAIQWELLNWSVLMYPIVLATLMIRNLLQVICLVLILDLSLGIVKNIIPLLFLQQNHIIKLHLVQIKKPLGFGRSFHGLDSSNNSHTFV
jgi:hypothetical protein